MFNAIGYWKKRHKMFLNDSRAVGNIQYSKNENDEIYNQFKTNLKNILCQLFPGIEKNSRSVLDIACGTGLYANAFIEHGFKYSGIDISPVAIKQAKKLCKEGEFYLKNFSKFKIDKKYDLLFARTVFIHFTDDSTWLKALDNAERLLADNGVFIIIDYLPDKRQQVVDHVLQRSKDEYICELAKRNLTFTKEVKIENYHTIRFKNI